MSQHNKRGRLQELGDSDFEIVEGQPDIRGWKVRDSSGNKIGEVEELILDAAQGKVRYMVVELDNDRLDLERDREVLVPIGLAALDANDDEVILGGITAAQLLALPEYNDDDELDDAMENRICSVFGRNNEATSDDWYGHEHFNDERLYGQRSRSERDGSGYGLRERSEASGMEVAGYMPSPGLGRDRMDEERTGIQRDEEIPEDATIPVNRELDEGLQPRFRDDEASREDPTGDNLRNAADEIERRSRGQLGGSRGLL